MTVAPRGSPRIPRRSPAALCAAWSTAIVAGMAAGGLAGPALRAVAEDAAPVPSPGPAPAAPAATSDAAALLAKAREARSRGDFAGARAHAEAAVAAARSPAERRDALRVLLTIELSTQRLHAAARRLPELRALEEALGNRNGVAATDVQTAAVDASLGRLTEALARIDDAVAWLDAHGAAWEQRGAHLNAARIRLEVSDVARSREHLERARVAGKGLGLDETPLHLVDGSLALKEGRPDAAVAGFAAAVAASKDPRSPSVVAARLGLVVAWTSAGKFDEARAELARAREAVAGRGVSLTSLQVDVAACLVALEAGDAAGAVEAGLAARPHADALPGGWVALLEARLARAYVALGDAPRALEAAERAGTALLRDSGALPDVVGARFRAERGDAFTWGVDAAVATGDAGAVFRVAERAHAAALRARLRLDEAVARRLDPALADERSRLEEAEAAALGAYRARLAAGAPDELPRAVEAVRTAREAADRFRERLRTRDALTGAWLAPEVVTLDAARADLAADEALVVFAAGTERLYAVVVTATGARLVAVGPLASVAATVASAVVEDRALPADGAVAALRALVAPLDLPATVRRVRHVPAGPVGGVAFAAVWPDRALVRLPSVTVARLLAARARAGDAPVLAAAGGPWGPDRPLPGADAEVRAVGVAVPGATVLVGDAATEPAVRAAAASRAWRAVHVAGHALVDPAVPTRSALALRPGTGADGLWSVGEVLGDTVRADLVVLSACSTATGRRFGADGDLGFAHAFFVAGARAVLGSLWDVDDDATAALMARFYAAFTPGTSAAEALQRAQADLRADPRYASPAAWAGWQVWGAP